MDGANDELQEFPIELPLYFKGRMGNVASVELLALREPSDQRVVFR